MQLLNRGGFANPDVLLVPNPDGAPLVVKDYATCSPPVRLLLAPFLVRHELAEVFDGSGEASESGPYWSFVARLERVVITEALQRSGGNQIQAARLLGINRNTLRRKIVELEIPTDEARSSSD